MTERVNKTLSSQERELAFLLRCQYLDLKNDIIEYMAGIDEWLCHIELPLEVIDEFYGVMTEVMKIVNKNYDTYIKSKVDIIKKYEQR